MNHYPRHIGDWMRDTAHLSEVEECIYSRCIDQYYSREQPLPADKAAVCRLVRATSSSVRKAVDTVLGEFFDLQDDGWHQKRCDQELGKFYDRSAKASQSAAARWDRSHSERTANAPPNALRTHSERIAKAMLPSSHKPVASNQEPEKGQKQERSPSGSRLTIETIPEDWRDYCKTERPDLNPERVFIDFHDYWIAKPGKDGRKADWLATWRNWVRREGGARQQRNPGEGLYERNLRAVGIEPEKAA